MTADTSAWRARTQTEHILNIAAALDTAAKLTVLGDAEDRNPDYYYRAADAALADLHESPSIARLRAAVLLLDGITDVDILDATSRYSDKLTEVLRRVDDGEL
jgi:hypothetical protein